MSDNDVVVVRRPVCEGQIHYRYSNDSFSTMDLWLAQPPECNVQDQVRVMQESVAPSEILERHGSQIARYRIGPFRTLRVLWVFRRLASALEPGAVDTSIQLSEDERELYLGVTPQIPRDPAIVSEARTLSSGLEGSIETARKFFRTLTVGYRYGYPVYRRGASEMYREHRGDCGQFSCLFVALCRARGIPARKVVGTLLRPGLNHGHAWAEFWVDGVGWIPVDPSLGQALALFAGKRISRYENANPESAFGQLEGDRFAFSFGQDLQIGDAYGSPVRHIPLAARLQRGATFGGRRLRWGYETLDGKIPYLQPAYPRCSGGWGLNFLLACSHVGYWSTNEKFLCWGAFSSFIQQTFLLLLVLVLLGDEFLVPASHAWIANVSIAAYVVLVLASISPLTLWKRQIALKLHLSRRREANRPTSGA